MQKLQAISGLSDTDQARVVLYQSNQLVHAPVGNMVEMAAADNAAAVRSALGLGAAALETYAEGTFTPTVTFATPGDFSPTYGSQVGYYTRIGNQCIFQITIIFSTNAYTTASGTFRILGVPFTPDNSSEGFHNLSLSLINNATFDASAFQAGAVLRNSGPTAIEIFQLRSGLAGLTFSTTNIPASTNNIAFRIAGEFRIAP